jgi:hypothetical protein
LSKRKQALVSLPFHATCRSQPLGSTRSLSSIHIVKAQANTHISARSHPLSLTATRLNTLTQLHFIELNLHALTRALTRALTPAPLARSLAHSLALVCAPRDSFRSFGTEDEEKILLEILAKGDLQVSKEEREKSSDALVTEIAKDVAARCINPDTERPFTIAQIERAMKDLHFSVNPSQVSSVVLYQSHNQSSST